MLITATGTAAAVLLAPTTRSLCRRFLDPNDKVAAEIFGTEAVLYPPPAYVRDPDVLATMRRQWCEVLSDGDAGGAGGAGSGVFTMRPRLPLKKKQQPSVPPLERDSVILTQQSTLCRLE